MVEQGIGVVEGQASNGAISSQPNTLTMGFAKLGLATLTTTLLLGVGDAFAICPCGDGICGGTTCFPPETSQNCPADCGSPPPPPPPPPAELNVRVFLAPSGDRGRFGLHVDDTRIATNEGHDQETGPLALPGGAHTLSVTAGTGTDLADYRTSICGACSADGAIQPGVRQRCSVTNLRLPTPDPVPPGCATQCVLDLFQCGGAGEPPEFCQDVFHRCLNRCQIPSARRFTIARYARAGMPSVNLTELDADRILADMSDVLRTSDGPDDIDCNIAFCRDGALEEYALDDGIIDNEAELLAVAAIPHDIKVARAINFCGGEFPSFHGCRVGDTFIVSIGFLIDSGDPVTWAHEYGHVRGLGHRKPDDPRAVMRLGATAGSRRVNSSECTAFRSGPSSAALGVSMPGPGSTAPAATNVPAPPEDIKDFVRQFFVHGVPYERAMRYGSQAVPTLLDMLADPKEEHAWPNIVMVLGMLGDERAVSPLISLIEQNPKGELEYFQYDAKKNAIFGLGYLINKSSNQRALAYLKDGLDPPAWTKRGITWISPEHETAAERNRELSRVAIIGLGLSGDPSAAEALRALLTAAPTALEPGFRQQMSGVIWEAVRANQRIAERGMANYHQEPAH
jgi:hypothetical protein